LEARQKMERIRWQADQVKEACRACSEARALGQWQVRHFPALALIYPPPSPGRALASLAPRPRRGCAAAERAGG